MREPAHELLVALAQGLEGWTLGDITDAVEIASFADTTQNESIPKTPQAVEHLLGDLVDAGFAKNVSRL